jgi:hypothetical protein
MKGFAARRNIAPFTMPFRRHHHPLHRQGLAWLLWLALLLPMAQTAALWHGVSHVASATASSPPANDPAAHTTHCDLCLNAAALGGGALPGAPLVLHLVALRHTPPLMAATELWLAPASPAYQSRAPPHSPA